LTERKKKIEMEKSEELSNKISLFWNQNKDEITDRSFYSVAKKALTKEEYESCFLSDYFSEKVDELAIEGDDYFEKREYEAAIEAYKKGIEIIPEPKNLWETKLWFTAAIADSYWNLKKYKNALEYLDDSLQVEGGKENAFIRLRRGQVLFELQRIIEAKQELQKGYELNGEDLFEDEDDKYLKLIKER
jgi:tetratricopeptide (TPR) repeat protein